jgi:hypothetical protein
VLQLSGFELEGFSALRLRYRVSCLIEYTYNIIWGDALDLQNETPTNKKKMSDPPLRRYHFLNCRPFAVKKCLPAASDRRSIRLRSGADAWAIQFLILNLLNFILTKPWQNDTNISVYMTYKYKYSTKS